MLLAASSRLVELLVDLHDEVYFSEKQGMMGKWEC